MEFVVYDITNGLRELEHDTRFHPEDYMDPQYQACNDRFGENVKCMNEWRTAMRHQNDTRGKL